MIPFRNFKQQVKLIYDVRSQDSYIFVEEKEGKETRRKNEGGFWPMAMF